MITDLEFYTDFLIWGDQAAINALEKISEEEYRRSFGDLVGSIAIKAGHLVGIYEFFISAIDGNPYDHFPTFSDLTKAELLEKWRILLEKLKTKVMTQKYEFFEVPLAKGKFVNIELTYMDSIFHSTHHRAQILSFLRLLGKDSDDIHPRDINVDFFNYVFKQQNQLVLAKNPIDTITT